MVKLDFLTLMASYLTCCALVAPGKQHLEMFRYDFKFSPEDSKV